MKRSMEAETCRGGLNRFWLCGKHFLPRRKGSLTDRRFTREFGD